MTEICGDNRFEIIAKAKAHLLDATNIDTSEDEMKVLDSFLFRCWQMGWLDRYAEPQTQLTAKCLNCNNSKVCKEKHWDGCAYEPKDEKTCETCRHWKYIAHEWQCEACKCQGYEPKDEPQTERKCIDCKFLTYMFGKTWCNIKCDNPHDKVCDRWAERNE